PDRADEADPDADTAACEEERVRNRDEAHEDEDRRHRADRDRHEALGKGGGQLDTDLAENDEEDREEAEEEDDLPHGSRVPADDGDRRPLARARVPARERRERQGEPEYEQEPAAPPVRRPASEREARRSLPCRSAHRRKSMGIRSSGRTAK